MKRLATALALLIAASYLIFFAPAWLFLTAAGLLGVGCYLEYARLAAGHGIERPGVFGLIAGLLLILLPQYSLAGLSIVVILALATALREDDLRHVLPQVACALFGALYAFAPWRLSFDLRKAGVHWLFFALALNWAGDSAAYYVGRQFGKHKLAPLVSPGKSWEGAAGSVAGSVAFGLVYMHFFVPQAAWWLIVLLALAGNVAGQFGDLAESAMKRGAGVKDSGSILPGHGGLLDRVDANLFAVPVVFALYSVLAR